MATDQEKNWKEETVLVTGASGFLGAHIIKQLLKNGYKVRGTVRDPSDKTNLYSELAGNKTSKLVFVKGILLNKECWPDLVKGCKYVIHTASPYPPANPEKENELIDPAVQGTVNILEAIGPEVRKVVITSCASAIHAGHKSPPNGIIFDEDCWAQEQKITETYAKSKVLAERAAWNYVNTGAKNFDLIVINPSFMLGPVINGNLSRSVQFVQRMLLSLDCSVPRLNFPVCDVRDVANAHVIALKNNKTVGHRHIICGPNLYLQDIAMIVDREFSRMGYSVATSNSWYIGLWFKSFCNPITKTILPKVGEVVKLDDFRMRRVLHISPRPVDQTISDTCHSLVQRGFVESKPGYRSKMVYM